MAAQGLRWTTAALLPGAAHLSRVHVLAVVDRAGSTSRALVDDVDWVVMGRRGG
jgi:hypothetical protein